MPATQSPHMPRSVGQPSPRGAHSSGRKRGRGSQLPHGRRWSTLDLYVKRDSNGTMAADTREQSPPRTSLFNRLRNDDIPSIGGPLKPLRNDAPPRLQTWYPRHLANGTNGISAHNQNRADRPLQSTEAPHGANGAHARLDGGLAVVAGARPSLDRSIVNGHRNESNGTSHLSSHSGPIGSNGEDRLQSRSRQQSVEFCRAVPLNGSAEPPRTAVQADRRTLSPSPDFVITSWRFSSRKNQDAAISAEASEDARREPVLRPVRDEEPTAPDTSVQPQTTRGQITAVDIELLSCEDELETSLGSGRETVTVPPAASRKTPVVVPELGQAESPARRADNQDSSAQADEIIDLCGDIGLVGQDSPLVQQPLIEAVEEPEAPEAEETAQARPEKEFDQNAFDALFYTQAGAPAPPPSVQLPTGAESPAPPATPEDKRMYLPIDPRIHWARDRPDEWYERKAAEIRRRRSRKQNFGRAPERLRELRELRESREAEARARDEAEQARRPLPLPPERRDPESASLGRPLDFGDVPEDELPEMVRENAAWMRACAWMRSNREKSLLRQKEAEQLDAQGEPWEHLVGASGL